MNNFHQQFYDNLDVSKRAIANWKKLRILIVLLKICGNKFHHGTNRFDFSKEDFEEEKKSRWKDCRVFIAPYLIHPKNKYKVIWDAFIGFVYLTCFFADPYNAAFSYRNLEERSASQFNFALTFILIVDIILVPFSSTLKKDNVIEKKKGNINKNLQFLRQ